MVALTFCVPVEIKFDIARMILFAKQPTKSDGGADAVHFQRVLSKPTDHIDVEHQLDLFERNCGMRDPVL